MAAPGPAPVYVCLCNALTDIQLRAAAAGARRPKEVFANCGCGARCASCTRVILAILRGEAATALPAA